MRTWAPGLFLSKYARRAVVQNGVAPNLDTLRGSWPQAPTAYAQGILPAPSYLDPKPLNDAAAGTYLSHLVFPQNQGGLVGALPMQAADPTTGGAVIGGLSLNMATKQYNFMAPVMGLAGRAGMNLALGLSYSSRVWIEPPGVRAFNAERGFPAVGWRLGFGSLLFTHPPTGWGYTSATTGGFTLLYLAPSGARHELKYNPASGLYESYDGTYLSYNNSNGILRTTDGAQLYFGAAGTSPLARDFQAYVTKITDRNGNLINISYRALSNESVVPDYVTDTAGRRIDFEYTYNRLTGVKQTRTAGAYYFARFDYAPVTVGAQVDLNNQPVPTDPPNLAGTQVWALAKITYPTGESLRFGYNSDVQINSIQKWVPTIPGQGAERAVAGMTLSGALGVFGTTRSEWAEHWQNAQPQTYGYFLGQAGPAVSHPLGHITDVALTANSIKYIARGPGGYISSNLIKTTETIYESDTGVPYRAHPRVVETTIRDEQNSSTRRQTIAYTQQHGVWLPQHQYEGSAALFYRRTEISYTHYPAQRIIGLPQVTSIYNASNSLLARTTNNYDETGSYTDSNNQAASYFINATADGVIQHDDTNYGASFTARGNLTSVTQASVVNGGISDTRLNKRLSFDTNGNLRAETDAVGHRKQIVYTDAYLNQPAGVGQTAAYPYTVADPTGFRTGVWRSYFSGLANYSFNLLPGGTTPQQTVATLYDFADRLLQTAPPNGSYVYTRYWDNYRVIDTLQYFDEQNRRYQWDMLDGAGRAYRKASDHPDSLGGKYTGQVFVYDQGGRTVDSSNAIAVNGAFAAAFEDATPGFLFTHYDYDALSRVDFVTKPDNNTVNIDYEGCGCGGNMTRRVTDELGVVTETKTDWLGRLLYADEPSGASSSTGIYSRAMYSYDELDRLTRIDHFDHTLVNAQQRYFSYDGYGRLANENTPEGGNVSYGYHANDQLFYRVDQRSLSFSSYAYNTRGLLTQIAYSDGTPTVNLSYDAYGARAAVSNGQETAYYSYNSLRQLSVESHSFGGLGNNKAFNLGYSYNNGGQVKTADMVSQSQVGGVWQTDWQKKVNYAYKQTGALSGVGTNLIGADPSATTNVINNTHFRATGALKQLDYGNGMRLTMGYSAERQQPTSMKVAWSDNPNAAILSYGYSYYDANNHNNNRIRQITDYVDGSYTTSYSYDSYNRLIGANSGAFLSGYQYDAWGNLTSKAGLQVNYNRGGWNQQGAPAGNHITNIVENGQTYNHTYDAAGNLINDGQKTYAYDGASRMTSVNGGALGAYAYNGDGQRVKKTEAGATTYYVYSAVLGGALFELNGTGVVNRVHVTAGGKEIAQQATDGAFYWLHTDHLGTPRKMTSTGGATMFRGEYDPHGNVLLEWSAIGNPNLNNNKFTGYERDAAAGLDFAQARHYKFGRGRFMQPDPIGLGASNLQQPESLNLYSRTFNDPINYLDTSGHEAIPILKQVCVTVSTAYKGPGTTTYYLPTTTCWTEVVGWVFYSCSPPLAPTGASTTGGSGGPQGGPGGSGNQGLVQFTRLASESRRSIDNAKKALSLDTAMGAACNAAIQGNQGLNAGSLLATIADKGNLAFGTGPGPNPIRVGDTTGRGDQSIIRFYEIFFTASDATRTVRVGDSNVVLTLEQFQALALLHELAHASNRYHHPGNHALPGSTPLDTGRLNSIIYESCIKGVITP